MKKFLLALLFSLTSFYVFSESTEVATLPFISSGAVTVVVDGSGLVYLRLPKGGMVLTPSDAGSIQNALELFLATNKTYANSSVSVTSVLGGRALVPLMPRSGKLFLLAVISKGGSNALGMRLVNFNEGGGWGADPTWYMTPETVSLFINALSNAVSTDRELATETSSIRQKILTPLS